MADEVKVFYYIIPILFMVLAMWFYFYPEQGFDKLREGFKNIKDYVPNPQGLEVTAEEGEVIPETHRKAIVSLKDTINGILNAPTKNADCFADYGQMPDLGSYGTSIVLEVQNGKTVMNVYSGKDGRKIIQDLRTEFEDMTPCVIAGTNDLTTNFFNKFIEHQSVSGTYYNPVQRITISYDEGANTGITCTNGNRIMTGAQGSAGPNSNCKNFEDGGMLFSPDHKHICFIPTNWAYNHDTHGINNDYISGSKDNSIQKQYNTKKLERCF